MSPVILNALPVLGGSLVGALTSLASSWLTQQRLDRRGMLEKQVASREALYADFISEASAATLRSMANSLEGIVALIPLYALTGRIRLNSSAAVLASARAVMAEIIAGYARPNLSAGGAQRPDLPCPEAAAGRPAGGV